MLCPNDRASEGSLLAPNKSSTMNTTSKILISNQSPRERPSAPTTEFGPTNQFYKVSGGSQTGQNEAKHHKNLLLGPELQISRHPPLNDNFAKAIR
jgi:hypothetical protein